MEELDVLTGLVGIPSVTGSEAAAVAFLQDTARRDGFAVSEDAAGNFVASTGRGDRTLLLLGHVDTAPGHIPVVVRDGALWGRGSVDAKGSLAAFYCAARRHLDTDRLRIVVVGAVDEEGDSRGARALPDLDPDWILIGEPSGLDGMTLGYKGILRATIRFDRAVVHGGHPEPNANDAFVTAWSALAADLPLGTGFEDVSGRIDAMASTSDGLRESLEARVQFRVPPAAAVAALADRLRDHVGAHGGTLHVTEALDAVQSDRRGPLAVALSGALRAHGITPRPKHKTGTSDWNVVAPRWPDAHVVAYGPGDSHLDHAPDEHLVVADFHRAVAVLDTVLADLVR